MLININEFLFLGKIRTTHDFKGTAAWDTALMPHWNENWHKYKINLQLLGGKKNEKEKCTDRTQFSPHCLLICFCCIVCVLAAIGEGTVPAAGFLSKDDLP